MDSSPPGSSVHGILQARILEWVAFSKKINNKVLICHEVKRSFADNDWFLHGLISQTPLIASLIAQLVKNLPAMQETPVGLLGQEDPLEKG